MIKFISCITLLVVATTASVHKPHYDLNDAPVLFEKFIIDYNRHYKSSYDKLIHYEAFLKTLITINRNNSIQSGATFDINEFADYTPEETKQLFGLLTSRKFYHITIWIFPKFFSFISNFSTVFKTRKRKTSFFIYRLRRGQKAISRLFHTRALVLSFCILQFFFYLSTISLGLVLPSTNFLHVIGK